MNSLRAAWRLARAFVHALAGAATITFRFPRCDASQRESLVQAWAAKLLTLLGIELEVQGRPCDSGPMLLVANHISWLDIVVMHASRYCRFVAKSEVRHWPLIGTLATGGGTIYIERHRQRDALRVVHQAAESLARGEVVAVFPEGTTSEGTGLLPFHGNLIQAAVSANAPVQPVALSFLDTRTRAMSLSPRYIDNESLLGSLWRTLAGPPVTAVVCWGEPQLAQGRDRRTWAHELRAAIEQLRRS